MLEGFAERARRGEIQFAAIAVVDPSGVAYSCWEPEKSTPQLITDGIGAVAYLSQRYMQAVVSGETEGFAPIDEA